MHNLIAYVRCHVRCHVGPDVPQQLAVLMSLLGLISCSEPSLVCLL